MLTSFEDTVRFHTEKYCRCYKRLNDFVLLASKMSKDSINLDKYQQLKIESNKCFDPDGTITSFGKSLDSTKLVEHKKLFDKYRQEICPQIIPKS